MARSRRPAAAAGGRARQGSAPFAAAAERNPRQQRGPRIEDPATGGRLFYAPGLAQVGDAERRWLDECACVMVDGTFWTEDEMVSAGLGSKLAADMGHLPQCDGPRGPGMLRALDASRASRKVLIHINNTNPILDEDAPERRELSRRGVEVAFDGMQLEL